ncbi:MAG: TatD family hydrolase [archaeon]|jgi:TatD DNase family protein
MLYDAHCHLDLITDEELQNALTQAKEENVFQMISCATSFFSNERTLELAKKYPSIKAAIGIYPLDALELNELELDKAFYFFEAEIKKAIAIGEVGLDFKYSKKKEELEKQVQIFSRFIDLAIKYNKPLIIHSRFAQKQVLELLAEKNAKKVLLHSFIDSQKLMEQAAKKGYFVSVGLSVLYNIEVQKNISSFPLENLLFETDSPIRFNGEKAAPSKVSLIADKVSELKKIPVEEIIKQQEKNFTALFEKVK